MDNSSPMRILNNRPDGRNERPSGDPVLQVKDFSVSIRGTDILRNIAFDLPEKHVLGLVGPSGAGKSTLLRCLNRLIERTPGFRLSGEILFRGKNITDKDVDADQLRTSIGILFQQPVVFPTTVEKNVLFGASRLRRLSRKEAREVVEKSLREAALWEQVKDRLHAPGQTLSTGQQQRLCLARTLATNPDIILMDEPTSALDPQTTEAIENLILVLREERSIILVTHNPNQADRVCQSILRLA